MEVGDIVCATVVRENYDHESDNLVTGEPWWGVVAHPTSNDNNWYVSWVGRAVRDDTRLSAEYDTFISFSPDEAPGEYYAAVAKAALLGEE